MHLKNLTSSLFGLTLLLLTACTMTHKPAIGDPEMPYPPKAGLTVGDIYHLPTGAKVSKEQMTEAITDARIVYIGETHDNPAAHRLELELLRAVAKNYPGGVSLGMEMFNTNQQAVLDQWVNGELNEKEFLKKSDWYGVWGQDFAYYRDILIYARDNHIPVIGLNISKDLRRKVSMNALDDLDQEIREQLPEMDFDDIYQRAMAEAIFADHVSGQKMLDGFLRVQTLWDESMAESIVLHLREQNPNHRMVVIAGGNHVRYGFGIPRRVFRRMPTSYVLTGIRELVVPAEKSGRLMNVEMPKFPMPPYDYIVYTEYESLPGERVKLGVRFKEADGRLLVESVVPGSSADKAGIQENDYILFLDDQPIKESFDLVYEVSNRRSGDQAILIVDRNGRPMSFDVSFSPLPPIKQHK